MEIGGARVQPRVHDAFCFTGSRKKEIYIYVYIHEKVFSVGKARGELTFA